MPLIHVYSESMDPADAEQGWYEQAQTEWLCTGCFGPRPGANAIDAVLEVAPPNIALNLIAGVSIGLARRDFLDQLPADLLKENLQLGEVRLPDGRPLEHMATFRARRAVVLRGNNPYDPRKCPECGTLLFHPQGDRWLPASELPLPTICETQLWGLLLDEALAARLSPRKWRQVVVEAVSIRDSDSGAGEGAA